MPPSPLDIIRQLASQVKRINPGELSRPQATEYRDLARKVYTPQFMEAQRQQTKWLELAAKASTPEQAAKFMAAAKKAEYDAARFSKLDQAASNIANAKKIYDDDLRAMTVPGQEQGIPGGISTYYPPGHYENDPMLDAATYLELLGTSPDAQGAGRVLLRQTGMSSPSNPMMWHSTSYPETLGFYESRGGVQVPKDEIPKESAMYGNMPVFQVPRGDMLKEAKGGWIDFTKMPAKASRQLHVSPKDVTLGQQQDLTALMARVAYHRNRLQSEQDQIEAEYNAAKPKEDPQQALVNEVVDNLRQPKGSEQRDFERGFKGVGNEPGTALLSNLPQTLRDTALQVGSLVNPMDWASMVTEEPLPGSAQKLLQTARTADARGASPEEQGIQAGVQTMGDTAFTAANLPWIASGIKGLASGAKNMATRAMQAQHLKNLRSGIPKLENISDLNPNASTFSGITIDPAASRRAALTAGAVGTGGMLASDDAEASPVGILRRLKGMGALPRMEEGQTFGRSVLPTSVVKPKGGNWLTGSVEDALRGLKTGLGPDAVNALMRARPGISAAEAGAFVQSTQPIAPESLIMNSWIEGPLTKYVKNRMATPEDEVRRLAEEGIGYVDFSDVGMEMMGRKARYYARMPMGNVGKSAMARGWEDVADVAATPNTVSRELSSWQANLTPSQRDARIEESPWLATLPPNTPLYGGKIKGGVNDLGFDHLIDELRNATNPESGLPRHLLLSPDAVKNLSMEKAVRRVADINEWRAAQKAEANAALANQASVVREYPHSDAMPNSKGLRWVELKQQESAGLPPGSGVEETSPGNFKYFWESRDGKKYSPPMHSYEEAQAAALASDNVKRSALQNQLKYEGDTMGHCVGGYCDNVANGNSRIFSLRDAKGEPHVTVEVNPKNDWLSGEDLNGVKPGLFDEYLAQRNSENGLNSIREFLDTKYPDVAAQIDRPRITQIKGKQNRKPNDEYLPFVQDFVKNPPHGSPWGDVGDLQNTGLIDLEKFKGKNPVYNKLFEAYPEQRYITTQEKEAVLPADVIGKAYTSDPEYAKGGAVSAKPDFRDIMNKLKEHHAHA